MFMLPDLPYDYSALEPFIDEETMHFHHDKHHAAYVKNLNDLLAGHDDLLNMDVDKILEDLAKVPEEIRQKVKNNAGGVANHSLFWQVMCSQSESKIPTEGKLFDAINSSFESFDKFKEVFSVKALGHFGSGWAWLTVESGILNIESSANQDTPVSQGKTPILLIDVWEHAYYLKYKNLRADYIKAWWNVVNWREVEKLYDEVR
jgi:Fe-Mn family superoxide dismutase